MESNHHGCFHPQGPQLWRADTPRLRSACLCGFACSRLLPEDGWPALPYHPLPPLREQSFSASLGECSNGPMHEISDLLTSSVTRWADERRIAHKGGKAPNLPELDECMRKLIGLFPI